MLEQTYKKAYITLRTHYLANNLGWMVVDALIVMIASLVAFYVRAVTAILDFQEVFQFITFSVIVTPILLYVVGVYRQVWPLTSGHGVKIILKGFMLSTIILAAVDLAPGTHPEPLSVLVLANVLAFGGVVVTRYRSRLANRVFWLNNTRASSAADGKLSRTRVLIIGANEAGQSLAWRLKHRLPQKEYIFDVVGFIDEDERKQDRYVEESPVLGRIVDITHIAERYNIDLIVIAPEPGDVDLRDILARCERTKARIKLLPDMLTSLNVKHSGDSLRALEPEELIGRRGVGNESKEMLAPLTDKVVLVTGAAGSIGSELCRKLTTLPIQKLILLDNNESGLFDLKNELKLKFPDSKLILVLADVTVREGLQQALDRFAPQVIFHAAAYKHVAMLEYYPNEAVRTNIGGTRLLAELASEFHVERFVLISTDKAVNPFSVMGMTKRACELVILAISQRQENRTLFTAVRFGNVLGSRGSVFPTFNHQIDNGGPVTITDERMKRYFMSIPEAAKLVVHASCLTNNNDIFVLNMGEEVRIVDLAERMIRGRGLRRGDDIKISVTGILPGEKLSEELYNSDEEVLDTADPDIVKIKWKTPFFDGSLFMETLDRILRKKIDNPAEILEQLKRAEWMATEHVGGPQNIEGDSTRVNKARQIPIAKPYIGEEEKQAVMSVLESGQLTQGACVAEFEEKFAAYHGVRHAVATNNGTTALMAALMAHDIGPGDEVIVPSFSFFATAACVLSVGARPVFADIDRESYCLSPDAAEAAITPRTKAIMPVHLYGQPADMPRFAAICRKYGLLLLEDAAQAHGAAIGSQTVGAWGTASFSFYPTKNMTTTEGGMVVTNDAEVARKLRLIRNQGMNHQYYHEVLGYNFRMTNMAAAIGIAQLKRLPGWTEQRINNANYFHANLKSVQTPRATPGTTHVYHQYTVRVPSDLSRDKVTQILNNKGIGVRVYYPTPIHRQPVFQKMGGYDNLALPETECATHQVLSLPIHPALTDDERDYIIREVNALC
ncbi:MAG: SDR family NAD(P)-dependent oxidoreductase [Aggregatilineales bacterium]